ncbi:hypothetical protein N7494_010785 [Penicillium frequentans]|uniref:ribonuclease H n=1 Tax=Penicillium frequentans TaxID=3151616 RepID=A0AAD6GA39_9EURO|nr:hypothetical protein N7494_010785 [Penicillium glabrum]
MSPSPDRDQKEGRRIQGPRRRSRSPDFYPPLESETRRQRSRSPQRRSRSSDSHRSNKSETRQKPPFAKQYNSRRRCEKVHIDERATFADAFGGSQKPDLTSQIPSRPHSHPPGGLPPHPVASSFKEVYDSVFGGSQKLEPPSHPLPRRVVGSSKITGSDAILVPSPSQSFLATNPEPFSGKVVNDLNRVTAKKLASDMLKMPLYKDGVYYYIFWTDGSFQRVGALNKGGAAAVWFDPTRDEWYSWREKPPYGDTTSNDAELLGIGIALRTASSFIAKFQQNHPFIPVARHEVFVFTDSSACLQLIPRAHFYPLCKQWARQSLLGDILEASASLKRLGANIQLHWVPSHSGVIGNEVADREARYAAHGEYVGQQASSGPWERPSAVTASGPTMTTINHTARSIARKHRDMVNRFNSILHPQGSKDYIFLL